MSLSWEDYRKSLDLHLRQPDEEALSSGYELGRAALASGMSLLELVETHGKALQGVTPDSPTLALDFLEEALSPFEMALRGYREANARLAEANQDLAEANRKLQETQAQLVHSAKMASLGTFTAGMAHEINNPLAFCVNHVHSISNWLVRLHAQPELEDLWRRAENRLAQTLQGLERIHELVLSLRRFSRLDEGHFKSVDVHEAIEATLLLLSHQIGDRIEVRKEYTEDGTLECYPGHFSQIMMNLLANAVLAIEEHGVITISTERSPTRLSVSVRDTGVGISPEHRERIFDPFFTTRPVGSGTGLGLAITFQLVQAHHGEITLDSTPGQGSCFTVTLPTDLDRRRRPGSSTNSDHNSIQS
jgi:two-component system NtrC family sensor kinase